MWVRHASALWEGPFSSGRGTMNPEHAGNIVSLREARFGDARGSNPEELLGAALAGCFAMALAANLEQARLTPVSIRAVAHVQFEKVDGGYEIRHIDLETDVRAPDCDELMLKRTADETLRACPVGKALKSVPIELTARLVGPKAQPTVGVPT